MKSEDIAFYCIQYNWHSCRSLALRYLIERDIF